MNWDWAAVCKLTIVAVVIGLITACSYPVEKTSSNAAASQFPLSPLPTAPGLFEEPTLGFSISFPESVSFPKPLDLPDLVFHVASESALPICQVFVADLSEEEPLEPAMARNWMIGKMANSFSEVEIVRAEMIELEDGIEALFLASTFRWQGEFFWGAHLIADHAGKRITVFGIDDGRLDRIESTVMSLKLGTN